MGNDKMQGGILSLLKVGKRFIYKKLLLVSLAFLLPTPRLEALET
jgi:hypothetical protein